MLEWLESLVLVLALTAGASMVIGGIMSDSLGFAGAGLVVTAVAVGRMLNKVE